MTIKAQTPSFDAIIARRGCVVFQAVHSIGARSHVPLADVVAVCPWVASREARLNFASRKLNVVHPTRIAVNKDSTTCQIHLDRSRFRCLSAYIIVSPLQAHLFLHHPSYRGSRLAPTTYYQIHPNPEPISPIPSKMNYAPVEANTEEFTTEHNEPKDCCTRCIQRLDCTLAGPWCIEAIIACFASMGDCLGDCCSSCGDGCGDCCTECIKVCTP